MFEGSSINLITPCCLCPPIQSQRRYAQFKSCFAQPGDLHSSERPDWKDCDASQEELVLAIRQFAADCPRPPCACCATCTGSPSRYIAIESIAYRHDVRISLPRRQLGSEGDRIPSAFEARLGSDALAPRSGRIIVLLLAPTTCARSPGETLCSGGLPTASE